MSHADINWTRVKELWDSGMPYKTIARECGLTPGYIKAVATTNWGKRKPRHFGGKKPKAEGGPS